MKNFHLPDLGEGLAEAEIREWYVKVGDEVKVDQPLASMETAKAVVDVPSPYAGKIVELHGKVNEIVKTGAPLVTFETDEAVADKGSVVGKLESSEKKWDDAQMIIGRPTKNSSTNLKVMPAARVLAQQMNIDLSKVTPTGPNGLITPADVKKLMTMQPSSIQHPLSDAEALHGVRRAMAQTMSLSHREVVPVTLIEDVDISHFASKTDITVKVIQAMIAAAKAEPSLNAWFDGQSLSRQLFKEVNLGLAVDTTEGLFVPVIKDAQQLSAEELRQRIDHFKQGVQARSLPAADLQGATMTLSNFGMIAGRYATPIVVPPAVTILGCGRSREMTMVKNGEITIAKMMPLSLTFDHRAVTGGEATRFLRALMDHLSS